MAPMMWQTIYIVNLILVMTLTSKIFFFKVNVSSLMEKKSISSELNTWKW